MRNYNIKAVGLLLSILMIASCSKQKEVNELQTQISKSVVEKIFVYNNENYIVQFDEKGNFIPTIESKALENAVSEQSDLTGFVFMGRDGEKTYLFNSEMEGYKYYENNIDKIAGRRFQIGHATNLLRDKLIQKYGVNIDYSNSQIYAEARAGVEKIYSNFNKIGEIPRDIERFMGILGDKKPSNRNNNSWQLWEDQLLNGEMFNLETEPNVWFWVHGDWDCNWTYAAAYLDWNYRQSNESWNDCISSFCFDFQPGAHAVAYAVYKDGFFTQGGCKKLIFTISEAEWNSGLVVPCQNRLNQINYVGLFCSNMHDNISSLRMQIVWQGCPIDFSDL